MSNLEKAFLFGLCAFGLYLLYTDPRCGAACKRVIRTVGGEFLG